MSKPIDTRTREQIIRMAAQTHASQKEISRALRVSQMTVSRILKNSR
jgi:DNA-directed RNA polymerase specialized sigma subunit